MFAEMFGPFEHLTDSQLEYYIGFPESSTVAVSNLFPISPVRIVDFIKYYYAGRIAGLKKNSVCKISVVGCVFFVIATQKRCV